LKEAFDDFARTQMPPRIGVCGKGYVVNPLANVTGAADATCPPRIGKLLAPLSPKKARNLAFASAPLFADGPKTRTMDDIATWSAPDRASAPAAGRKDAAARADNGGLVPYLAQ
jgi:hypothetical protein